MKYTRAILLGTLLYVAATIGLWPYSQQLLPVSGGQTAADSAAELYKISPQAPVTLSTEPDDGIGAVTQAVEGATKSIDLVVYELQDAQLQQELLDAHNRGVSVRVLIENLNTFGRQPNQSAFDFLKSHGVPVEWSPNYFALTHQKTLVVDGDQAYIMTFNLTSQYYASSRDFCIVDGDPADIGAIEAAFSADWSGQPIQADNGDDLVWSPGSANTLLALIRSASTTLDIYNEEMTDPRILDALAAAAARGVHVRVDMTYATSWKEAFNQLTQAGVEVRTYSSTAKFYIHAKVLVADGSKAFVGSENFSAQSLDQNRELGILVARPDSIASLEATFNKDWVGARPYSVKN